MDKLGDGAGAAGDEDVVAAMVWAAIVSITATAAGMSSSASKTASKADFQSAKRNRQPRYAFKRASASGNDMSVPTYSLMIAHAAGSEVGAAEDTDEWVIVGSFPGIFFEPFWSIYLPGSH